MLVYHAYADINHGVFRAFMLHRCVFGDSIEMDYWRILDFLYLFPHKAADIKVPRGLVRKKNQISRMYSKYNDVKFPREFLTQVKGIHASIANVLSAKGVVSSDDLKIGKLKWLLEDWPSELERLAEKRSESDSQVLTFLKDLQNQVPANGPQGIKARSGWMEFRYDA